MLADSYIVPRCAATPGSFGGLMALYESNFIKLAALLGDPASLPASAVSVVAGDLPLHVTVDECAKYTRVLRLTYQFAEATGPLADPDLCVRVYLDARLAEVRSWARHHHHGLLLQLRREFGRELDRRWSRNMMLGKWLDYLAERGHRFTTAGAEAALPA